ncbi:MAG: aspartate aminotransferase family protein [Candidatus Kapaibacterium sp.]
MLSDQLISLEHDVIMQTYKRIPVVVRSTEGCRITDVDGNTYLDMLSGIAVNALGYTHPRIIEAIDVQSRRYLHLSNLFYQEPQIRLAQSLTRRTGFSKVVYSNSGAESWDAAIKLARLHGHLHGKSGDIIGFSGGFHGRTYGALSTMDKPLYKEGMGPFLPSTAILPFNDAAARRDAVNEHTCAVGLEFIQGEGGIRSVSEEFVAALIELRERYGFVIIADEVQTGVGRTGDFFAYETYGITPDIVTMAKGIGGGLPLGAMLVSDALSTAWKQGQHGSTYGGNALACATGLVVMEELENGLLDHVRRIGAYLHDALNGIRAAYPAYVTEIRGRGLMAGVVVHEDSTPLRDALLARRVITSATATNVIRIVPPFIITEADVDECMHALRSAIEERISAITSATAE